MRISHWGKKLNVHFTYHAYNLEKQCYLHDPLCNPVTLTSTMTLTSTIRLTPMHQVTLTLSIRVVAQVKQFYFWFVFPRHDDGHRCLFIAAIFVFTFDLKIKLVNSSTYTTLECKEWVGNLSSPKKYSFVTKSTNTMNED